MKDFSYRGKEVLEFDNIIRNYTGVKYAVCTNTGTAALHLSYLLAGIKKDDEVLVPTLTFIGTVNSLSYIGAIPHFIDCGKWQTTIDTGKLDRYLNLTLDKVDGITYNTMTGKKVSAIIPVHVLGNPCDMDEIIRIAKKWNLIIVEDACQSLGSFYKGAHMGNFGTAAAISFNGNKIITTGGGGAILTNYKNIYEQALHLSMTAKVQTIKQTTHNQIGYNYRMPAINAAFGIKQFKTLQNKLENNKTKYKKLSKIMDVINPIEQPNYWRIGIKTTEHKALQKENIQPFWSLISESVMYQYSPKMNLDNSFEMVRNGRFI